ncbi:hypothetical protein D9611_001842 [Ephemerocybe angulata]|uniref:Myb/SANT-like domain-containing protein n=1 Tax=Ephemerocybe angulata TaxID=980116 RepID=A0A8H5FMB3_9AGAR|nr:hypothetical protein D9611_001842 [Tulosesus angulatus]
MPATPKPWNAEEEAAFCDFLVEHKAEAGDNGTFKKTTYEKAARAISHLRTKGGAKDASSCMNKWNSMRKTYRVVTALMGVSGFAWDDTTGASVGPESAMVWDDYVAKHPAAKPFRNKGWVHRAKVALLMPSSTSTTNVFHPLASQSPPDTAQVDFDTPSPSPSPENDAADAADAADDSADEESSDTSSAAARKRKRQPSTSQPPASKRTRTSAGASALQAMVTSMDRFGDKIAGALVTPDNAVDPAPLRRTNAVNAARKKERWLNRPQMVLLLKTFQSDIAACDIYLSLLDDDGDNADELRMDWIAQQVNLPSLLTPLEA